MVYFVKRQGVKIGEKKRFFISIINKINLDNSRKNKEIQKKHQICLENTCKTSTFASLFKESTDDWTMV